MSLQGKKLLYIFDASDWDSRYALAQAAMQQGAQVTIGLIGGDENKTLDAKIILLHKNPGAAKLLSLLRDIGNIVAQEKPDIIHAVTLKYSFVTALAALTARHAHKILTIAGLGYLYRSDDTKSVALRYALWPLLVFALRQSGTDLIFQNIDDMALLIRNGIATSENSYLIKGSGVYLDRFNPVQEQEEGQIPLVFMPTRLVHEKGVAVFIKAARILKDKDINARFEIAGGLTHDNPRAITQEEMEEMIKDSPVTWLGRINNIPEKLTQAAMVVYPSYYGEGIPRVLLEACAAGRPVITTDHPGCREAVDHGVNGLLVPVKDPVATAAAIEKLLANPKLRKEMGTSSRRKAEAEFDIHEIVQKTLEVYQSI